MTIYYLMVKTHKITGLKYLCQTKRKNPYTYSGSGKYWKQHLAIHGKDIDTKIICECQTPEELKKLGLHYSELWNVVESSEWANLMPETGINGVMNTPESIAKCLVTKRKNGTMNSNSPESIAKRLATQRKNGTINTNTPESIAKGKQTKLEKYGSLSPIRPGSIEKGIETRKKNGTMNIWTPELIDKAIDTKRKNGTINTTTPESIEKRIETRKKNGTLNTHIRVCCIYCKRETTTVKLSQWHGDKCKFKPQ